MLYLQIIKFKDKSITINIIKKIDHWDEFFVTNLNIV